MAITVHSAHAQGLNVPDPTRSTISKRYVALEGNTAGVPDACSDGRCGAFTVTVRDYASVPILASTVVIDLVGCPDLRVSCDQLSAATGQVYFASKKVAALTDAAGQVTFRLQGASTGVAAPPGNTAPGTNAGVPCAIIYADGVPLGPVVVSAFDIDGLGSPATAVDGNDVKAVQSECLRVLLGGTSRARDDYNGSGKVSVADVAISAMMALDQVAGTGSQGTGPYCP